MAPESSTAHSATAEAKACENIAHRLAGVEQNPSLHHRRWRWVRKAVLGGRAKNLGRQTPVCPSPWRGPSQPIPKANPTRLSPDPERHRSPPPATTGHWQQQQANDAAHQNQGNRGGAGTGKRPRPPPPIHGRALQQTAIPDSTDPTRQQRHQRSFSTDRRFNRPLRVRMANGNSIQGYQAHTAETGAPGRACAHARPRTQGTSSTLRRSRGITAQPAKPGLDGRAAATGAQLMRASRTIPKTSPTHFATNEAQPGGRSQTARPPSQRTTTAASSHRCGQTPVTNKATQQRRKVPALPDAPTQAHGGRAESLRGETRTGMR